MEDFFSFGVIAGIFARTDTQRGVWKAVAGLEATLVAGQQMSLSLTETLNEELDPLKSTAYSLFQFMAVWFGVRTHSTVLISRPRNGNIYSSAAWHCLLKRACIRD